MKVRAWAPSNIALIKYMGKTHQESNKPTNSSLSLTLDHLKSFVQITLFENSKNKLQTDEWRPLNIPEAVAMDLSPKGQQRFLNHFQNLKNLWGVKNNFLIESANNFPSDCGLASSASSFAALTMAASEILQKINPDHLAPDITQQAALSQKGSGSSCRSFLGPWCLWKSPEGSVEALDFAVGALSHQVIVVDSHKKIISSSEAHKRVGSSALFIGRPQRAEQRVLQLIEKLKLKKWSDAYQICWAEFWDMHALFETSDPAFGYMQEGSLKVLRYVSDLWDKAGDGPLATMDAGPNVHLLYRQDQKDLMLKIEKELKNNFQIYSWVNTP